MTLTKEEKHVRIQLEGRMRSVTFTLPIDDRKVTGIINYIIDDEDGVKELGFWVKIKPTDSYLDRELRASGKLVSRLLQHGEPLKDIVDTLSQDNIIGHMVNYYLKNKEEILTGAPIEKKQRMLSTDPYAMKE
tara:strand:+ start:968 stop:1366 length:399 start_codon:yes stop_codon:yes gene_type:complete